MRQIEKTVFNYTELPPAAQEKAREWLREAAAGDGFYAESVIDDAATIADMLGIDLRQKAVKLMNGSGRHAPVVYYSGFNSQGDGASFEGSYSYKKGACKAVKAYAPEDAELQRIAKALQDTQRKVFYSATCNITQSGRNSHSNTMYFDFEMNENVSSSVFNSTEDDISCSLKGFANWIYSKLEEEHEWENSDAQIEENILANDYEFNEDGRVA